MAGLLCLWAQCESNKREHAHERENGNDTLMFLYGFTFTFHFLPVLSTFFRVCSWQGCCLSGIMKIVSGAITSNDDNSNKK